MAYDKCDRLGRLSRRRALALGGLAGAGLVAIAPEATLAQERSATGAGETPISAVEDLMREHGVLRRLLVVYAELVPRLRSEAARLDPGALADAARLFRAFGEEYHERILEEEFLFPELRRAGGTAATHVEALVAQHQRGREITDYIERIAAHGRIAAQAPGLAAALADFVRMYNAHAAWEDTVTFPTWRKRQSKGRLDELAERFEEIEKKQFGGDGFDLALERVARIERTFGLDDVGRFTAAAPGGR
jgi:hemerythrin-like domain-containing protein